MLELSDKLARSDQRPRILFQTLICFQQQLSRAELIDLLCQLIFEFE